MLKDIFSSWPADVSLAILAIVIVFFIMFRRPISAFLERTKGFKAGPVALEAADVRAEQQIEAPKTETLALPPPPASSGQPIVQVPDPLPLYDPWDTTLRQNLDRVFGDKTELKLAWAIRQNSMNLIDRVHETSYRLITTSQISVLKRMNLFGNTHLSELRKVYDEAAGQNPAAYTRLTWDVWITFLKNTGYVLIGEGLDPIVILTPLGKNFLLWMVNQSVMEVKPW
jgi:hypothetical protein